MRVCLVSLEYPPETGGGGIGTQTYLKAHGLRARGHEIHVVSSSWDYEERTYQDRGITIHRIPVLDFGLPSYEQSTYWLAYSMAVAQKIHALSQHVSFDIMQFPEYGGEGFIYQTDFFKYRTARFVVQLHGPLLMFAEHMGWPTPGTPLYRIGCFMEQTVMHHADLVLASSHNTAAFCANKYDYPLDKIRVIHSGINTERFKPRAPAQSKPHPKILFVGTMVTSKGINLLVESVIKLRERYPNICLRAIGKGEEEHLNELKRMIDKAGAQSNFDFIGYVPYEELPDQYARCDLFAGPSTFEPGPGNVYLEAMASGKPVIACNTGGAPEIVLDHETGLLVPPHDVNSLAEAITTLADSPDLCERLGKNGRLRVEENFSEGKYIDKVESYYKELIEANA